jgi:hypothetical protein
VLYKSRLNKISLRVIVNIVIETLYVQIIFGRHYHQIIVMVTLFKISEVLKLDLLFVSFICFELKQRKCD